MKKKSFLSGYTAKIAMVAVALSSAVLTGCYKDEGLDVSTPAGDITFPAATYMLNVSVVDETGAPVPTATISVNGTAQPQGASCSVAVQPGSVSINATAPGYTSPANDKVITVASLENGQSAVYTEVIVLEKTTFAATYNLSVNVVNAEGTALNAGSDYELKVLGGDGAEVTDLTNIPAGSYTIFVNSLNAAYESNRTTIDLAAIRVTENTPLNAGVLVVLNKVEAPVQYLMLYGEVTNFPANYENLGLTITKDGVVVAQGNTTVQYQAVKGDGSVYRLVFTYRDNEGNEKQETRRYTDIQTSFTIPFSEGEAPAGVEVENGVVTEETIVPVGGGDGMTIAANTQITTSNDEPFTGTLTVSRFVEEEAETAGSTRIYNGMPSGLKFSTPLQFTFADNWGGELGALNLEYLTNTGWNVEGTIAAADPYVMEVAHFSSFRAQVASEVASETEEVSEETVTTVDKYNDTDNAVTVTCNYTRMEGIVISDVQSAVAAQFQNTAAAAVVTSVINARLAQDGYVAQEVKEVEASQTFVVQPHSVLNTVKKTQYCDNVTYTFTVNEKTITVNVTAYTRVEIDGTDQSSYDHGHGHGHGGDLNAGGGIVEAE